MKNGKQKFCDVLEMMIRFWNNVVYCCNQDTGYGTVRFDIIIEEIDTVIEIKCTRKDHSDNKLYRELGEDGYFYKCSNLIIYVYDKNYVIRDVDNFVRALERTKDTAGKEVKVYVEQAKKLV